MSERESAKPRPTSEPVIQAVPRKAEGRPHTEPYRDAPDNAASCPLGADEPGGAFRTSPGAATTGAATTGAATTGAVTTGAATTGAGGSADGERTSVLLRSSGVMAAGTVVSRVTGFLRNLVVVVTIGTHTLGDIYGVANTLPNIVYILIIGGALNSVFVPQLVRAMTRDADGGDAYASRLITVAAVILLGISALSVLAAPALMKLFAHSYTGADLERATLFARYCLPQIFFYGLYVVLGQVLNARDRYGAMMWTPIMNNVVVIATFGLFLLVSRRSDLESTITPAEIRLLGIGTTLGIVVQALALVPYVRTAGVRLRPRFDWRGVGLGKAGELAKWTVLFVAVNQLSYLVVVNLATSANEAAQRAHLNVGVGYAAYNNAYLLFMLPHSIITVSLVTALVPRMSRAAAEENLAEVRNDVSTGLRLAAVALVPAMFAFFALGVPMATAMYVHGGAVNTGDAAVIGFVLMGFAFGLLPFSGHHLLLRGFHAFENTRTPFFINIWINVANVALALLTFVVLPLRWRVVGMAVAYSLSYLVGFAISAWVLRARLGGMDGARVRRTVVRLLVAGSLGAIAGTVVAQVCQAALGHGFPGAATAVGMGGLTLLGVYVLAARRMRVEELSDLTSMVTSRLRR